MTTKEKYNIIDLKYYECVKDILENRVVQSMEKYIQHGNTSTLKHSISVSYISYKIARKLGWDYISVAKAGLLHDFYLYDWHKLKKEKKIFKKHGYVHSRIALNNANKYFKLNKVEKDIILKHMWPLTFRLIPKYKESLLVSVIDKCVSVKEFAQMYLIKLKNLVKII